MLDQRTKLEKTLDRQDDELITQGKMIKGLRGDLTSIRKLVDRLLNPTADKFMEGLESETKTLTFSSKEEMDDYLNREERREIAALEDSSDFEDAVDRVIENQKVDEALSPFRGNKVS